MLRPEGDEATKNMENRDLPPATQAISSPFVTLYSFTEHYGDRHEYRPILLFPQCQVMYCFTELLRNFLAVELPRQQELLQEERSQRARDLAR